jgi:hypothetical protein
VDGPGSVEVALDEGQGLKKLSSFVHFWNTFPLLSAQVIIICYSFFIFILLDKKIRFI